MAKEYKLTLERLKELQDELTYLKTVREKEVAELIKEARSFGDLSENSEYDEAKTEQGKLYSRIAEVEEILGNCVVIEDSDDGGEYVRIGSTVTVLDKEFDETEVYKIVGSQEADPMNGVISEDSPFGKALLGKNAGDEVTVDAPAGPVEYKILKVERRTAAETIKTGRRRKKDRSGSNGRQEESAGPPGGEPVSAAPDPTG